MIGDNGAGKSTLIKALTGALIPDAGEVYLDGQQVHFRTPQDARGSGIETVYQTLAVAPALDISANMFLGRERLGAVLLGSVFRMLDKKGMKEDAGKSMANLGIATVQNMGQAVETLSGGQRQAVAVARAATFATKFVVLDEPTAALGREGNRAGTEPDPADQGQGASGDLDQPQHAQRVRGVRPDPYRPAGRQRRGDHAEVAHSDRGGGDHDRRHHPAERLKHA